MGTACDKSSETVHHDLNKTKIDTSTALTINNIINETVTDVMKKSKVNHPSPKNYSFIFNNLEKRSSHLTVENDFYSFSNIKQPLVMVVLASTWCPPCRGEVPHLSSLQKKFKDNLFILSALIHDDISDKELKKLIISEKVNFYVSTNQEENLRFTEMITEKLGITSKKFTLPLMVLFSHGTYFTHYEGSMPEEMIESDIKQLLNKIKK